MKNYLLIVSPYVLASLLSSCGSAKPVTYTNASFTEKDEVMITANSGYASTSVAGYGGILAIEVKQALYQKKLAETEIKLKEIPGIQIHTVQNDDENGFIAVVENDILFELNSFDLTSNAAQILSELVTVISDMPETDIQVTGYTDSTGTEEYNLNLSKFRANAVGNFLRESGIGNVSESGKGAKKPVASNDTEDGRKKNRRVEIKFSTHDS